MCEKVTMENDIIVVGAGPCGSFSALTAAKLGAKVTVFEEHPVIGAPSHCAGHLSLSGLKRLGLELPPFLIENMFKSAIFFSPSGKQFSVNFSSPVTCVVNRELFDRYLAEIASNTGARFFLGSRVKGLIQQKNLTKGVIVHKRDRIEKIMCNIVIDAEGNPSKILKNAGLKQPKNRIFVKAVSAEVNNIKDVENDRVEVYLDNKVADGFYAWIIPKRNGTAKIGLATRRGNPKQCLEQFLRKHKIASVKLRKSQITGLSFHLIPLGGPISKTFADGLLIVGDAASQVKPTTGGGIITGLTCAETAGKIATQAVREGNYSESFLKRYEEQWRQKIGFDMKTMLFARKLLNNLSNREVDKLFDIATKLRLEETLVQVKDVDFQGKELLRVARRPSAFTALAYFLFFAIT